MSADFNLLTSKQKKVYYAIESFIKSKGIPPTVREIGEIIGEKTPGAVQGILTRLEQKGAITREAGIARSIRLVSENKLYKDPVYFPEIKKINSRNIDDLMNTYNIENYLPIASSMVKSYQDCFFIKCPDLSLYESGMKYEDMLLVCPHCDMQDGDIVIVLYDTHTLVRYYYKCDDQNCVILKADSDLINKETFSLDEIRIVGKVVGKYSAY